MVTEGDLDGDWTVGVTCYKGEVFPGSVYIYVCVYVGVLFVIFVSAWISEDG